MIVFRLIESSFAELHCINYILTSVLNHFYGYISVSRNNDDSLDIVIFLDRTISPILFFFLRIYPVTLIIHSIESSFVNSPPEVKEEDKRETRRSKDGEADAGHASINVDCIQRDY